MDKLVKNIQGSSGNSKDLKNLAEYLAKNEGAIFKSVDKIDSAIEQLDPKAYTLGYIFLLYIKSNAEMEDATLFISQCQKLFSNLTREQALYADQRLYRLSNTFTQILTKLNMPMQGLLPLKNALNVARANDHTLTPIHADFLQLCLIAKCYSVGAAVAKQTILSIVSGRGYTHTYYLKFHYYGGMIFLGVKDFKRALHFFDRVVSARAVTLSAIMLEGYKKYVLCCLLVNGKLPSGRTSMVQRHLKALTQPYQELATSYETKSVKDVKKCLETNAEHFVKDKTFGLVKQAVEALYNSNIKSNTKTFLTLSLKGIAENADIDKVDEAEARLLRMIEKGHIFASVDEKQGIVAFSEAPEKYDTSSTLRELDIAIKNVIRLGDNVQFQDNRNALNFSYIQRTMMQEQRWEEQDEIGGDRGMGGMFRG